MPQLLFPGVIGLIILAVFALKTIEGGGDWLDFLNCTAKYEAARTDFDFMLMFAMVAIFVVGIIGFAVYKAQVGEPAPAYQAETQPVSIAQHKSAAHTSHKTHVHHVSANKK